MNNRFTSVLPPRLNVFGIVEQRLLAEYGAMFVAKNVVVPDRIVFRDDAEVSEFQSGITIGSADIGGIQLELQAAAMDALIDARDDAERSGLSLTPRDTDSARRSYDETVGLWASRVEPALDHWVAHGRLEPAEADQIRSLSAFEQVPLVFALEEEGIFFAKDLSKSIVYSVAPPGTSQHLAMLAFDIKEHADAAVREILSKHFWFQTVISDLPHFTYLGMAEDRLSSAGLKCISNDGRRFWVPDL